MSEEQNILSISGATFFSSTDPRPYSLSGFTTYEGNVIFDGISVDGNWTSGRKWNPSKGKGDLAAVVVGGKFTAGFSNSGVEQHLIYDDVTVSGTTVNAIQTRGKIFLIGGTYSNCHMIAEVGTVNNGGAVIRPRKDDLYIMQKEKVVNGETVKVGTVFDNNSTNYGFGGAIHGWMVNETFSGKIYIDGATFSNNKNLYGLGLESYDTRGGGAIGVQYQSYTLVQNAVFDTNSALSGGGAIIVAASKELDVFNTEFKNNSAFTGGAIKMDGAILNVKDSVFTQNSAAGETIEGNLLVSNGGAIYNQATATITNTQFYGNSAANHGGAVYFAENRNASAGISGSTFCQNYAHFQGGAIFTDVANAKISDCFFSGNTAYDDRGGAICVAATTTITGSTFVGNIAHNKNGGAIRTSSKLTISDCKFYDNQAKGLYNNGTSSFGVGGALALDGNNAVTITNTEFSGNIARKLGGAIYVAKGTTTIKNSKFLTSSDTIYNLATVNFSGNITLNASLEGTGVYSIADGSIFTFGAGVDLNGVDFSNATIKVDGAHFNKETEVVTNIGGSVTNLEVINNPFMTLVQNGTSLLLKEIAGETINSTGTVSGDGLTIMSDGSVTTFIGQKTSNADMVATKISGGMIGANLIAGAFAKAENGNAAVKHTELNVGGEADVNGQVYAGGYFYGTGTESTEAQMTVDSVNIALDGGKVNGNLYAGIHARAAANVKVNEISISVSGGEHDRIYAGGWAEGKSYSKVGESVITLDGGKVNFIYGGGATGGEETSTYVGATTITVSGDAEVGTIFMSGRYGYSSTGDVELNWYGTSNMKRLSGVSSAGIDNADSTTVNLFSDLTADGIDFVDKFILAEGVKLTANVEFLLGNRVNGEASGATIFDFTTNGLDGAWDAIAGISDFEHALFSVNGGEAVEWDGSSALAIGNYELTYNKAEKLITIAQA